MKDAPLISVIIPVYNISGYILKCLNSIKRQSYTNLEIIIVDDGSTDDSGRFCDGFGESDNRARVFHKKNGGLSSARNFGLDKARGEIIAFIDGDDYIDENFIKKMYGAMAHDKADVVVCGYNNVLPKKEILSGRLATAKLLVGQENLDILASNKLYKKKLFKESGIKYPVGYNHEDNLTTYKILAAARMVSYIPESLYNYIKREDSIMGRADTIERLKMREMAAEEAAAYFIEDDFLRQASEVAILTAKYAFMDAAIHKEIEKKYFKVNAQWVDRNRLSYKKNRLMTKKLKLYNFLNHIGLYKLFRTIV
ncbi:glycosyltransferase [Candidatus Saccharibacteria bacterium]|nr:glycosyltransferase [Candidatus Saccharibacteria bacterium]